MTKTIYRQTINQPIQTQEQIPIPPPSVSVTRRSDNDIVRYAGAAIAAGAFLAIGAVIPLVFLGTIIENYIGDIVWRYIMGIDLFIFLASVSWYGFRWIRTAIERGWRLEDEDRRLRYQISIPEEVTYQKTEAVTDTDVERLNLAARKIMELHYLYNLQATRPECDQENISQSDWNLINRIMQEIKIKGPRSWFVEDHSTALRMWKNQVRIESGEKVWVRPDPKTQTWKRISN